VRHYVAAAFDVDQCLLANVSSVLIILNFLMFLSFHFTRYIKGK